MDEVKACSSCGEVLPLDHFHKNGPCPRSNCRDCAAKTAADRRLGMLQGRFGICSLEHCDRPCTSSKSEYCQVHYKDWALGLIESEIPAPRRRTGGAGLASSGLKECGRCRERLPVELFHKNRNAADGLQHYCKLCVKTKTRMASYKIDEAQFLTLLTEQDEACASCGELAADGETLHVDHDHNCCPGKYTCGQCVRGLLHRYCNQLEGHVRRNPYRYLAAFVYYMKLQPAQSADSLEDDLVQRLAAEVQLWMRERAGNSFHFN